MERSERSKEYAKQYAKHHRDWLKSLSPEALKEYKQNKIYDKERREDERKRKAEEKVHKSNVKRELTLLKYMLKHDVSYFHHGKEDSMKTSIQKQISYLQERNAYREYDPYIWNRQGEGKNYNPLSHLGCLFSSNEFKDIYEVPLDGTYKFHIYDSGERGLGSFNRITATKIEQEVNVPYVNPGAMFPITAD
jgi:hypothetical protein